MPTTLVVHLHGVAPETPFTHATGLRALILRWINAACPEVALELHASGGFKPYAISPLWPDQATGKLFFTIAITTDTLLPLLLEGAARDGGVRLGRHEYRMAGPPEIAGMATWEELTRYNRRTHWSFTLESPSAHHAETAARKAIVLPSPELYFRNWLFRWNRFAPLRIDEAILELVNERVAISTCAGCTQTARLDGRRPFIGFCGTVTFTALHPRDWADADLAALDTLARFATYCGTGVETVRGMGQTRLCEKPS